jgi:hypothetical protein
MPNMITIHGPNLPLWKVLASPFLTLQQALAICDDYWTWTTQNGDVYEDVDLLTLSRDEVTFRHKYGVSSVARADLAEHVQQSLIDNTMMAEPDDYRDTSADEHYLGAHSMAHADGFSRAA